VGTDSQVDRKENFDEVLSGLAPTPYLPSWEKKLSGMRRNPDGWPRIVKHGDGNPVDFHGIPI
jgi:hypothetical protein